MNQVLSVISSRRSHRAYKQDQLTQEQIDMMIDFSKKVAENIKNIEEVI